MPFKCADIEKEYVKNKDLNKDDVDVLKQWVQKQAHLPDMSELQLIIFLQSCYCKLEATKVTIDTFFSMKTNCPDFFSNRDPELPRTRKAMDCGCFARLPNVTAEGYNVLFFTFMDGDPNNFCFVDLVKIFDMNLRLWLEEDGTSQGLIIVIDIKQLSFTHLTKIGMLSLRDFIYYLQDALPVRLKGLHFINAGVIMDKLMLLMKPFLKKELLEMLYIHKDVSESLFKIVLQKCLPKDYGGEADSLSVIHEAMKAILLANADYFINEETQMGNESKRELKRTNSEIVDYCGVDGSFKKLEID